MCSPRSICINLSHFDIFVIFFMLFFEWWIMDFYCHSSEEKDKKTHIVLPIFPKEKKISLLIHILKNDIFQGNILKGLIIIYHFVILIFNLFVFNVLLYTKGYWYSRTKKLLYVFYSYWLISKFHPYPFIAVLFLYRKTN